MRLQLLSDLHLETEQYDPEPAPGAELLVLAGDIDSRWDGARALSRLAAAGRLRRRQPRVRRPRPRRRLAGACASAARALGITMLERESLVVGDDAGARIRIVGTTRWSDFDLFGAARPRQGDARRRLLHAT